MIVRMNKQVKRIALAAAVAAVPFAMANELPRGTSQTVQTHARDQLSQKKIDKIDLSTREAAQEYLSNERTSDVTEAYNQQVSLLVDAQRQEMADLKEQIQSIEETDRAVLPMLNEMVQGLSRFISADTPFLLKERHERLARLEKLLLRADVSVAEKYRQILEAYSVEVQYGRTFEAYRGSLTQNNDQQVLFLRLGRAALYYQTLSGLQSGMWEPAVGDWVALSETQNLELTKAIQIAQQQQVPTLLNLPLPELER